MVKRWLGSHWLLGGHITEEVVELLCAAVFLGAKPGASTETQNDSTPGTKERGFALVVRLLADWDWEGGLHVPLYGSNPEEDQPDAPQSHHISGPSRGAWHVRTELDTNGRMWTTHGPDAVVARRVKDIAKATWHVLQSGSYNVKVGVQVSFSESAT